jgi:hypothetical protein
MRSDQEPTCEVQNSAALTYEVQNSAALTYETLT